jgi:hypothetical protein
VTTLHHMQVLELWEKTRVQYDHAGEHVKRYEPHWAVWDTTVTDDETEGWFAIVSWRQIPGYQALKLSCRCSEGFAETESECRHERAVIAIINPPPTNSRASLPPNVAAFVD